MILMFFFLEKTPQLHDTQKPTNAAYSTRLYNPCIIHSIFQHGSGVTVHVIKFQNRQVTFRSKSKTLPKAWYMLVKWQ